MIEENKSAVEKYAELKLKQERDKAVANSLALKFIIILLLFSFIYVAVESMFITPKVLENTLSNSFGDVHRPIDSVIDQGDGYVMVMINANSQKEAMNNLRDTYTKLSKKITTNKVDKIYIMVSKVGNREPLLTSSIWVKDLKSIDWMGIDNYNDFIEKSNIILE